ncbi:MAG: DUF4923 family protein [Rikenellaceae bacterium]
MKNYFKTIVLFIALFACSQSKAQSISDLLNGISVTDVIETVTGGQSLTVDNITGEWNYLQPAVQLDSDSLIGSAAGVALASQAESTLETYCTKVGIVAGKFTFTINSDSTFSFELGSRTVSGTYTLDSTTSIIKFSFTSINLVSISAYTSIVGDSLSLLFNADKLITLVNAIASSSSSTSLSAMSSLLTSYDGVLLGFEFSKTAGTGSTSTTSTAASAVSSALSNLFGN